MIELKVYCDCGQKYKFDVKPVNGQMPFTVACPICRRDGTTKANELLQQMAVFKQVEPAPAPIAPPPFVPKPTAPPPIGAPPPAPSRMRVNMPAPAATPAPPAADAPPPIGARPRPGAAGMAAATATGPAKKPSFGMGILGGFIGALIGSLIYYLIYKTTGVRIFLALGVGALAGAGAHWLGKGEGSKELGGITVVFVIVGILAAQYFVALEKWHQVVLAYEDAGYTDSITEARQVVKVIPTGSDAEIRIYLAKQNVEEGEAIKPGAVSADQIKEFREKQLPGYQDLAAGKVTKEQYLAKFGLDPERMKKFQNEEGDTFKSLFMLIMLSRSGLITMVIGAGLAYKMSTNA